MAESESRLRRASCRRRCPYAITTGVNASVEVSKSRQGYVGASARRPSACQFSKRGQGRGGGLGLAQVASCGGTGLAGDAACGWHQPETVRSWRAEVRGGLKAKEWPPEPEKRPRSVQAEVFCPFFLTWRTARSVRFYRSGASDRNRTCNLLIRSHKIHFIP